MYILCLCTAMCADHQKNEKRDGKQGEKLSSLPRDGKGEEHKYRPYVYVNYAFDSGESVESKKKTEHSEKN